MVLVDELDGKWYVFNRVHNPHGYNTTVDEDATHVGMFGAKSEEDTEAVDAYKQCLAMGGEEVEIDHAAAHVQNIYRRRRRRMGAWGKNEATTPQTHRRGSPSPDVVKRDSRSSKERMDSHLAC